MNAGLESGSANHGGKPGVSFGSHELDLRIPHTSSLNVQIPDSQWSLSESQDSAIKTPVKYASSLSSNRKLLIAATVIFMNFNVTLGSSLPSGAGESLDRAFGVTSKFQKPLPVAVFLVGYIFGPIVFAPLSESWGRRPVFLSSFTIYTAFTFGCAFAPNWSTFLFFRFMLGCAAAAPQTVSGGLFSDIYPELGPRGLAVTVLGLTSNVGPLVGPIVSGFTASKGWKWQFWVALILAGANWPLLLMMPETFAPVLNAKAAPEFGKMTPDTLLDINRYERTTKSSRIKKISVLLTRPIRVLREPLVFFTDLFILYQYIIFFLYFGAYPIIFRGTYDMSPGVSALMFIPTGIGAIFAILIFVAWDTYHRRAVALHKPWAAQEEYRRLPLACLGGPLFALSEFWLGWAARRSVHWSVPALSGVPLGIGIDLTFLALNNYLTDAYGIYSASVLASSVITRNLVAALVIPLTTYPLYETLGTSWACTLLGGLCLILTPIPFAFIRWGPVLRERSPFSQKLARMREAAELREKGQGPGEEVL